MISPYSQHLLAKLGKKLPSKNRKLVPNLNNKSKYIVHYRNLKFYLKMGLKITWVHRVIQFKQSRWLKPYIDFNTDKRKMPPTISKKTFTNCATNAVFVRWQENFANDV